MNRVLIIAYEYPPLGGVGVLRPLKLSKYLSDYGWEPHVLSVRNPDKYRRVLGERMNEKIPKNVRVYRSFNILPINYLAAGLQILGINPKIFFFPDIMIGWIPHTVYKAKRIIEKKGIDLIYATCPPYTSVLIGAILKKITKKPLVVDFRDAWTLSGYATYPTRMHEIIENRLEKHVLKIADCIIVVNKVVEQKYISKYPFIRNKIFNIYNGFDIDDLPTKAGRPFEKFTILYSGTFGGRRSPEIVFKAMDKIFKTNIEFKKNIQLLFIGHMTSTIENLIKKNDLESNFVNLGYMSHKKVFEYMFMSHMLLLIEDKNNIDILPAKTFDYLVCGLPILALIPNDDAKQLIKKYSDGSYIIESYECEDVKNAIIDAYNKWLTLNQEHEIDDSTKIKVYRNEFNQKKMTERVVKIIEQSLK